MSSTVFDIFVYQFNPLSNISLDFDNKGDESYNYKNQIFKEILESNLRFNYRNIDLKYNVIYQDSRYTVLKIANTKYLTIEKDFKKEKVLSEPSASVIIDNDPINQRIYIEQPLKSFTSSSNLRKILEKSFKTRLRAKGLSITINEVYNEQDFWNLVKGKEEQINAIKFEFSYYNLADAHKDIAEGLKLLNNSVNGARNKTEIIAEKGDHLTNLNENNEYLNSMVTGSADGQGGIKYKELGNIHWKSTDVKNKTVEVNLEITEGMSNELIMSIIDQINAKM